MLDLVGIFLSFVFARELNNYVMYIVDEVRRSSPSSLRHHPFLRTHFGLNLDLAKVATSISPANLEI